MSNPPSSPASHASPVGAPRGNRAWVVVFACFVSLIASSTGISFYVRGLFLGPMTGEFHWTRTQFSTGAAFASLAGAAGALLAGPLADRFGVRRVLIPGIVLYAAITAAFSLLDGSYVHYLLLSLLLGPFIAIQSPLLYGKVVAQWVDRRRGLALAVALMGTAVGSVLIPPVAQYVIAHHGWRAAYVTLGAIVLIVALPISWWLVREPSAEQRAASQLAASAGRDNRPVAGLIGSDVMRRYPGFWFFTLAIGLNGMAVNGLVVHLVPLLKDRGHPMALATTALAIVAMAQVAGRFASGFLLDRIQTPRIGILWFAAIGAGLALIGLANSPAAIIAGTILCGLGLGAELELGNYIISRLYGLRSFGQLFGVVYATYVVGVAAGGYLMGLSFDRTGGYGACLVGMEVAIALGALLMLFVEPYRFRPGGADPALAEAGNGG